MKPLLPGSALSDLLKQANLKQGEFASHIGVSLRTVNRIVSGRHRLTPEMANLLSCATGTEMMYWMELQAKHDVSVRNKSIAPKVHDAFKVKK